MMTTRCLVLDAGAIAALDSALIERSWFDTYEIPANAEGLRRVIRDDITYILSNSAEQMQRFLFINCGVDGVFKAVQDRQQCFDRILRVALRFFDRNVTLPIQWQVFHKGPRLSVYAQAGRKQQSARIYFDQATGLRGDLYAFGSTIGPELLGEVACDMALYHEAMRQIDEVIYTDEIPDPQAGSLSIVLKDTLGQQVLTSGTLNDWISRRLSKQQLEFVDKPYDAPIRLRGAAGTGKTQAMVVKLLKDIVSDYNGDNSRTFAFVTHSSSLAHDVVRGILYGLDPSGSWRTLKTCDGSSKLWIGTLYELAEEHLGFTRKGLDPLSLDGREGQEYQRVLIEEALQSVLGNPRVMLGILDGEDNFRSRLEQEADRKLLIEELLNEFAAVLDAEQIRKGSVEADRYLDVRRERWQMLLLTRAQRLAVLEIHDAYRVALRKAKLLSLDQIIFDYGRYLSTNEWEQLKERDGFDAVFVDEYHYFNKVEALILQRLFKSRAQVSGRWPLFMAYDLKQSTTDAPLGGGISRFRNPGVGASVEVELRENYRSSPQITSFLRDFDAAYPAMDLEGEYKTYISVSRQLEGDIPEIIEYSGNRELIDSIFRNAMEDVNQIGGRKVAILCLNERLFDAYRAGGRKDGMFVAVTSREDIKELQYAKKRCVFSMPEYVAGLQFDSVFLIHADDVDIADEAVSQGARRRYLNELYLGASRARRKLIIASSAERGGVCNVLTAPIHNGSLIRSNRK